MDAVSVTTSARMVTMQVPGLAHLLDLRIRSADGEPLGRIGAVYVQEGTAQPLLAAFPADAAEPMIAPLFGAELDAGGLKLAYSADLVTAGPTVGADETLSLGEVGTVLRYFAPDLRTGAGRAITDRVTGTCDVAAADHDVRIVPRFPLIGDDDLPPIVVTRPGHSGPRG